MTPPRRLATEPPEISNLVPAAAPFADRDDEIEEVFERLGEYQAVLIHDPPDRPFGYGASQVAVAYCHRYIWHYSMIWLFDCAREKNPVLLAERLDRQLDQLKTDYRRLHDEPLDGPTSADWIFVYDNVADPDAVKEHFPEGNARILVTSRTAGAWEQRARLCVGPLSQDETVKLFREVAAVDQPQAERLAEIFDGHPGQVVRVAEQIRRGDVSVDQWASVTEIVRLAPPPARRTASAPVLPGQRRGVTSGQLRTSLATHLLRSPVCRDTGSYRRWISDLRRSTGVFVDDQLNAGLPIRERVDALLDLAFERPTPDVLNALADTVGKAADAAGSGQETAGNVREIVKAAAGTWAGTAQPRPRPSAPTASAEKSSCFFFTSWHNRDVHLKEAHRFHEMLHKEVAARRGEKEVSGGFIDLDARHGAQWEPRLIEAIRTTRLLVPLITQDYVQSTWCRREWAVMMERIRSVAAEEGDEPIAILPVFWVRPAAKWLESPDFSAFTYRPKGDPKKAQFPENVYDLMGEHSSLRLRKYVTSLAKYMVEVGQTELPHLDKERVMELPLAFPEVNDSVS